VDLLITLAHRTMFVVGGVLCVWLAYRLLHIGLAGTQSMIDDLTSGGGSQEGGGASRSSRAIGGYERA
jgi:hypothetical protein